MAGSLRLPRPLIEEALILRTRRRRVWQGWSRCGWSLSEASFETPPRGSSDEGWHQQPTSSGPSHARLHRASDAPGAKLSLYSLVAAGTGLVLMTAMVAWGCSAAMLNDTPIWVEAGSLFLMSWFILLGAAVGVRESDHLGFEFG